MVWLVASQAIDMRQLDDWGMPALASVSSMLDAFVAGQGYFSGDQNTNGSISINADVRDANGWNIIDMKLSGPFTENLDSTIELTITHREPGSTFTDPVTFSYVGRFTIDLMKDANGNVLAESLDTLAGSYTWLQITSVQAKLLSVYQIELSITDPTDSDSIPDAATFAGSDSLYGSDKSDYLLGYGGNDFFQTGKGDDTVDGGAGVDTVRAGGHRTDYTLTKTSSGYMLADNNGIFGTDTLLNVERIEFPQDMRVLAFDTGPGQTAGEVYRLYKAAFARTPDQTGLTYWLNAIDNWGETREQIAHNFLESGESRLLYGFTPTNAQLINALYHNVLNRVPDQGGFDYWMGLLENHQITQEQLLINFSESTENVVAVAPIIQDGLWMT